MATTHNVSTVGELNTAIAAAVGGDTISMASGTYGHLDLTDVQYTGDYVTFVSADSENRATFASILMRGSQYIKFDTVLVSYTGGVTQGSSYVLLNGGNNHIWLDTCEIHGNDITATPPISTADDYAIYCYSGSPSLGVNSYIYVNNCHMHDVGVGCSFFGTEYSELTENLVGHLGYDGFKIAGMTNGLVQNNTHDGYTYPTALPSYNPSSPPHCDFIQFQGSATNCTIRGNFMMVQNYAMVQGNPYMDDSTYTNCLIEQNIIYSGMANSIYISAGSGNIVRNNTCLTVPNVGHTATVIRDVTGTAMSVNSNNIKSTYSSSSLGSSLTAQYSNPAGQYYYNTIYANAMVGMGGDITDLTPVAEGLGETMGAYTRIMELLGENAAPSISTAPTISGAAYVGATQTATPGVTLGSPVPSNTWQWYNDPDGIIAGATSQTYLPQASDQGDQLYVVQTATNSEGFATSQSANTATIGPSVPAPGIQTKSPADNATSVDVASELILTFDTDIYFGSTGLIQLWRAGQSREEWDPTDPADIGTGPHSMNISGQTLTIRPLYFMMLDADYSIHIDTGVITNIYGVPLPGWSDDTTWNWSTGAAATTKPLSFGASTLLLNGYILRM